MEIVKKSAMQDGTKIQIEDWSGNYSFLNCKRTIVAYPRDRYGATFRAERTFDTLIEAKCAFECLERGLKTLKDFGFTAKESGRDILYQEKL